MQAVLDWAHPILSKQMREQLLPWLWATRERSLQEVETGECLAVIDERVCGSMNITNVQGLTEGQRTALKLMGAVDHNDRPSQR
jgi:hypothetical protein